MNKIERKREEVYRMKMHRRKIKCAKSSIKSLIQNRVSKEKKRAKARASKLKKSKQETLHANKLKGLNSELEDSVKQFSEVLYSFLRNNSQVFKKKDIACFADGAEASRERSTVETLKNDRYVGIDLQKEKDKVILEEIAQASKVKTVKRAKRQIRGGGGDKIISEFTVEERNDLEQIPLYTLLKKYNLQQYAKQLVSEGFGYDLSKLARLTAKDQEEVLSRIRFIPGHRSRFEDVLDDLQMSFPKRKKRAKRVKTSKKARTKHPAKRRVKSKMSAPRRLQMWNQSKENVPRESVEMKATVPKRAIEYCHDTRYLVTALDCSIESQLSEDLFEDEPDKNGTMNEEKGRKTRGLGRNASDQINCSGEEQFDLENEILKNVFSDNEQLSNIFVPEFCGNAFSSSAKEAFVAHVFCDLNKSNIDCFWKLMKQFDHQNLKKSLSLIMSLYFRNKLLRELSKACQISSIPTLESREMGKSKLQMSNLNLQNGEITSGLSTLVDSLYQNESWMGQESTVFYNKLIESEPVIDESGRSINLAHLEKLFQAHRQFLKPKPETEESIDLYELDKQIFGVDSCVSDEDGTDQEFSILELGQTDWSIAQDSFEPKEPESAPNSDTSMLVSSDLESKDDFVKRLKMRNSMYKIKKANNDSIESKPEEVQNSQNVPKRFDSELESDVELMVEFDKSQIEDVLQMISPQTILEVLKIESDLSNPELCQVLNTFIYLCNSIRLFNFEICVLTVFFPLIYSEYLLKELKKNLKRPFNLEWIEKYSRFPVRIKVKKVLIERNILN